MTSHLLIIAVKKYTLAFTVITRLIRVILLYHLEDFTEVCVIQKPMVNQ